jgi:hypothetical protein
VTTALPDPPKQLPDLTHEFTVTLPAGTLLLRAHDLAGNHTREFHEPRHYGPLPDKGRFDHHPPGPPQCHPDHGVIHVACDDPTLPAPPPAVDGAGSAPDNALDTVLTELAQDDRDLHLTPGMTLTIAELTEPLEVLDVRRRWSQITRAGTHLSTAAHHLVHPWARKIRTTYEQLHGVLYVPSTGGRAVAVALNETAAPALQTAEVLLSRPMIDLPAVTDAAQRLQIGITF